MRTIARAPWGDLVMHVLSHVRATAHLAPSLYDARYVAWAERALGPAASRSLADDATALGVLAPSHGALASAQLVAWLFRTKERARACEGRALAELDVRDVDAPELLASVQAAGDAAELLWCAALLEAEAHARLPDVATDPAIAGAIDAMTPLAPELARASIASLPSLRVRGRVLGDAIWIGAPCEDLALSVEHVAWQAAHEATVREVSLARALDHHALEAAALDLLAGRARAAGASDRHAAWRACFAP